MERQKANDRLSTCCGHVDKWATTSGVIVNARDGARGDGAIAPSYPAVSTPIHDFGRLIPDFIHRPVHGSNGLAPILLALLLGLHRCAGIALGWQARGLLPGAA